MTMTMFRTRTLFSRLFRLHKRRPAKVESGSASVAQASSSLSAPPPLPPKQHRPVSLHPEAIHNAASRPHSLHPTSHAPTSVSTSNLPSSNGPPPRVVLTDHPEDGPTLTFPPPPAHAPPSDVGARLAPTTVDDASRLSPSSLLSTSKSPHARCVSFQLPPATIVADADGESVADSDADSDTAAGAGAGPYRPTTPSSTTSTLVGTPTPYAQAKGTGKGGETAELAFVPTDPPPAYTYNAPAAVSPSKSTSAKARHVSLLHPQPVRKNVTRFSMPVRPTAGIGTDTRPRDGRRESKRTSAMLPLASGSGMTKKEKRTTRWSRELNKPGTQEVLMALRAV